MTQDRKRWFALVVLSSSLFIIVLDTTILNVAVPTIIRDLNTDVSAIQWVISGYALVFASFLITFGRLGDIFGRRKLFFIGATTFAIGSFVSSISQSAPQLFIGEALLEGLGAAAMLPATLSIISATFQGRERGVAFAVWGGVAGGAGALGPWIGGILTTYYSWRWAFRINVVIVPVAIAAALFVVKESKDENAHGIDPTGVVLITLGLVTLVFGIIEAGRYGWWKAIGNIHFGHLSIVPISLGASVIFISLFVGLEMRRVRERKAVVFDFTDLRHPGFRYGLVNTGVLAMGEFGAFFVLPLFLQAGLGLSAVEAGTWLLPAGIGAFIGAGLAARLSHKYGPKYCITAGLTLEALGIWGYVLVFGPNTTFLQLLPALLLHGIGIGFATSQLTNVVLSDIPVEKSGSASGAAGMIRQVGTALGIALIGAIFAAQATSMIRHDVDKANLPAPVRSAVLAHVSNAVGGGDTDAHTVPQIETIIRNGVSDASKPAVGFAGLVVTIGAFLSLLVPNIPPDEDPPDEMSYDEFPPDVGSNDAGPDDGLERAGPTTRGSPGA